MFQVCHGPCLLLMPHLFSMESICDASPTIVDHCAAKFNVPHKTAQPQDVLSNPKVDVVLILTSDESHSPLAVAAIEAGKFVLVEKPLTLSIPSCEAIVAAEKQANARGQRVFVGYMRRYAPSFLGAFKREIASIPRILYARVRDFSGPNARFVNESGTFPVKPPTSDLTAHVNAERTDRLERLFAEAFSPSTAQQKAEGHGSQVNGTTGPVTDVHRKYCRFLGSLGSHDISLMREALGFPEDVAAVSAHDPFYSAIFNFRNADGTAYAVTYESGIDEVPVFDAHLSVYGAKKRVTIQVRRANHGRLPRRAWARPSLVVLVAKAP